MAQTDQPDAAQLDLPQTAHANPPEAVHVTAPDAAHVNASPVTGDPLTPGALPLPGWFGVLAAVCALGLAPWIVYLAFDLPNHARSAHYALTWVGFDTAMFAALSGTALAAHRRSTWTEPLATVAAVLLVTDAWMDVTSAATSTARMEACLSAVLLELPLAILCAWVASNTERLRRRAYRSLWRRMADAEEQVRASDAFTSRPPEPRR